MFDKLLNAINGKYQEVINSLHENKEEIISFAATVGAAEDMRDLPKEVKKIYEELSALLSAGHRPKHLMALLLDYLGQHFERLLNSQQKELLVWLGNQICQKGRNVYFAEEVSVVAGDELALWVPPELIEFRKSPFFRPMRSASDIGYQLSEILNFVKQKYWKEESLIKSHPLVINDALLLIINRMNRLSINTANLVQQMRPESARSSSSTLRVLANPRQINPEILNNGHFQLALNTVGDTIGVLKLANGLKAQDTVYQQLGRLSWSLTALRDLSPVYIKKYLSWVLAFHESDLVQKSALTLLVADGGIKVWNLGSNLYKNHELLRHPFQQLVNAIPLYFQFAPWHEESYQGRIQLYATLKKQLLGVGETPSEFEFMVKNVLFNAMIQGGRFFGAHMGKESFKILYWINKLVSGFNNYSYYPPVWSFWNDKANPGVAFFINRLIWERYTVPLLGTVLSGIGMGVGREFANKFVNQPQFISQLRQLIDYALRDMFFNPEEQLRFENDTPPQPNEMPNNQWQMWLATNFVNLLSMMLKNQIGDQEPNLWQDGFHVITNPASFLTHSFKRSRRGDRVQTTNSELGTGLGVIMRNLQHSSIPADRMLEISYAEWVFYSAIILTAPLVFLFVLLPLWQKEVSPIYLAPICIQLLLSLSVQNQLRKSLALINQAMVNPDLYLFNTNIESARGFQQAYSNFLSQIAEAKNESQLPSEAELDIYIAGVNRWLQEEGQSASNVVHLRSVVNQLNIAEVIKNKRQEKMNCFFQIQFIVLNKKIMECCTPGIVDFDQKNAFFTKVIEVYKRPRIFECYPTLSNKLIAYCQQLKAYDRETFGQFQTHSNEVFSLLEDLNQKFVEKNTRLALKADIERCLIQINSQLNRLSRQEQTPFTKTLTALFTSLKKEVESWGKVRDLIEKKISNQLSVLEKSIRTAKQLTSLPTLETTEAIEAILSENIRLYPSLCNELIKSHFLHAFSENPLLEANVYLNRIYDEAIKKIFSARISEKKKVLVPSGGPLLGLFPASRVSDTEYRDQKAALLQEIVDLPLRGSLDIRSDLRTFLNEEIPERQSVVQGPASLLPARG